MGTACTLGIVHKQWTMCIFWLVNHLDTTIVHKLETLVHLLCEYGILTLLDLIWPEHNEIGRKTLIKLQLTAF